VHAVEYKIFQMKILVKRWLQYKFKENLLLNIWWILKLPILC